ncbi:MAG: hypothetical protein QMC00_05320 [Pseudomonadales bacterium]|jgi:hypothetical protein|nr:hypothetical protein [Gammaproteobacteria bacterium]|tara:strand:- start:11511 stop:11909 length:399 start_codon:yes stop_codon:yes gene_type:complete
MSVGVWKPGGDAKSRVVDPALLSRFSELANGLAGVVDAGMLDTAGLANENWVMTVGPTAWEGARAVDSDTAISLTRLFTLVEEQVSGWEAGNKSPVIPLVKILKERGDFEADLRKWIKSNTKNRYLPNGSAL